MNWNKHSHSEEAIADALRAEEQLQRRAQGSGTFRDVRAACGWYFEARDRMSGPQGMSHRGETGPDGGQHIVSVDGGKGGDLHEVLATVSTIGSALDALQKRLPRAYEILVARVRDGKTYRDLEKTTGISHSTLSVEDARAEAFLLGCLHGVVT